jgi:hypothetical protein
LLPDATLYRADNIIRIHSENGFLNSKGTPVDISRKFADWRQIKSMAWMANKTSGTRETAEIKLRPARSEDEELIKVDHQ